MRPRRGPAGSGQPAHAVAPMAARASRRFSATRDGSSPQAAAAIALINILINVLFFGAAYVFGDRAWASARAFAALERRTAELDAERERTAAQAVILERVRIARELHDVVAHHVSVMGVQAVAARRVLERDPAKAAAAVIEAVEADEPPYMLLLGNDASDGFRAALDALRTEVDAWEPLSRSTDFDE